VETVELLLVLMELEAVEQQDILVRVETQAPLEQVVLEVEVVLLLINCYLAVAV
jgi:hypothetical protein